MRTCMILACLSHLETDSPSNSDSLFLHATLSTSGLLGSSTITAEGGLEGKQSTMEAGQQADTIEQQLSIDPYLFSDEEVTEEEALPAKAADDVVPDSSDEASTGSALDMDMDLDIDMAAAVQAEPPMGAFLPQQQPMQPSASASSATRKGVFTRCSLT